MLRILWEKWKVFGQRIFFIQARVVLAIFYVCFIIPIGKLAKIHTNVGWVKKSMNHVGDLEQLKNQ